MGSTASRLSRPPALRPPMGPGREDTEPVLAAADRRVAEVPNTAGNWNTRFLAIADPPDRVPVAPVFVQKLDGCAASQADSSLVLTSAIWPTCARFSAAVPPLLNTPSWMTLSSVRVADWVSSRIAPSTGEM